MFIAALGTTTAIAIDPPPDQQGNIECAVRHDEDGPGDEEEFEEDRTCCYWEWQDDGEHLHMCLECDENWRNCKEVFASQGPGSATTTTTTPSTERAPGRTSPFVTNPAINRLQVTPGQ